MKTIDDGKSGAVYSNCRDLSPWGMLLIRDLIPEFPLLLDAKML